MRRRAAGLGRLGPRRRRRRDRSTTWPTASRSGDRPSPARPTATSRLVAHGHLLRMLAARWIGLPPVAGRPPDAGARPVVHPRCVPRRSSPGHPGSGTSSLEASASGGRDGGRVRRLGRGEGVVDGEGAVVERPADDDAGQAPAVDLESGQRARGGRAMPTPPDAITSSLGRRRAARRRPSRSGPEPVPSTSIWVTTKAATPGVGRSSPATSSRSRPDPSAQPRTATSRPRTSRPSGDLARVARGEPAGQVRAARARRCRPRPGPRRRRAAPRPASSSRTPPPVCTGAPTARGDGGDHRPVHRLAGAGGVEVDDVDPRRAGGGEAPGLARPGRRRRRSPGRSRPGSRRTQRPSRRSIAGYRSISGPRRSRSRRRRLDEVGAGGAGRCAADFSGWNWVAHSVPRSTAATTGPP